MSAAITAQLLQRRHWIFDLDGTLTVPLHDFPAIRAELGLTEEQGTLEGIQALPAERRDAVMERLDEIGWEYATQATPQPGVLEFLRLLADRGCVMGVVTRNNHPNLDESLRRCGMEDYFAADCRFSRDQPPAKPSPEPLRRLLRLWDAEPSSGVMVGDAVYDLKAGRAAGVATLYLDSYGHGSMDDLADLHVQTWQQVLDFAAA